MTAGYETGSLHGSGGKMKRLLPIGLLLLLLGGCGSDYVHVAGPFYLSYIETPDQMALVRCPNGPENGCAGDGLPGETVYAAGANDRYIVFVRHPHGVDHSFDRRVSEYFYFARIKNEWQGWGNEPEKVVGPLTDNQFQIAKWKLGLPNFSIFIDDLK